MNQYKLKEGVKCFPFGAHCKEVVNEFSTDAIEGENQILLTDELAEYLISSEKLTLDQLDVTEVETKKNKKQINENNS